VAGVGPRPERYAGSPCNIFSVTDVDAGEHFTLSVSTMRAPR
jgi:hypothetical protein